MRKRKNRGYPQLFFEASKVRVAICDWKKDTLLTKPVKVQKYLSKP